MPAPLSCMSSVPLPCARMVWQELQSLEEMVRPVALVCLLSWQRKQPGQSLWPMLFG